MPEGAARAYLRDLPDAELHLLEGGHGALETNLDEIVALTRDFPAASRPRARLSGSGGGRDRRGTC
ncbi:hypothetical protein [Nonomuraea dietziae]|uniref:hypothetical protein n=1 Tax=Nonomuraea dietziae TaxID=65515 RepID=UPI0033C0C1D2